VCECSEISDNVTKLTLHQQVTIVGQEGLKLITSVNGFIRITCRNWSISKQE